MSDELVTPSDAVGVVPLRTFAPSELVTRRRGIFPDTGGFSGLVTENFLPDESPRPYDSWFDIVVDVLGELLSADGLDIEDVIEKVAVDRGELAIFIAREHIMWVARYLQDNGGLRFEIYLGTSGVHYPSDEERELHAIYPFWSIIHNRMIRLKVTCPDVDPRISSIVSTYPGNDWQERETWDLIGITFDEHPSLARTALPDDQIGHPQHKNYPLGSIPVEYKGATITPADMWRSYK